MDSGVVKMDLRVLRIDWQKSVIFCVSSTVAKWLNGILCLGVIKLIYKEICFTFINHLPSIVVIS